MAALTAMRRLTASVIDLKDWVRSLSSQIAIGALHSFISEDDASVPSSAEPPACASRVHDDEIKSLDGLRGILLQE